MTHELPREPDDLDMSHSTKLIRLFLGMEYDRKIVAAHEAAHAMLQGWTETNAIREAHPLGVIIDATE